jgi:hypothetical protein
VDAFRPICLQNCCVKILAKILTTKLQAEMIAMIDIDQTGFLKGRSISENFVYATELVQVCYKRKVPTIVLKLDFAKAFDTVNWAGRLQIMLARGFSERWCAWVQQILSTSLTAVLVNGCPGPWIPCRRGLRQGDPMSPYLFLLVADVLQTMVKHDSGVRHPLMETTSCSVLQYADDTFILLRGELSDVLRLRELLDSFSNATGLKINYTKSTAMLMHLSASAAAQCVQALGCRQEGFPQTYLGLPLSFGKLRLATFEPYIARADRYLVGWQSFFLNPMGRTVLINLVLDSQLIYLMCAIQLPPGLISKLDQKRRGFLWAGDQKASGASCLVAWDKFQTSRQQGGLGIKNLGVQNCCLLLKLVHQLHCPEGSSWAAWVRHHANIASLDGELAGPHWAALRELLPLYQAITTVQLGNGAQHILLV